ncbi:uncharacterized protein MONOS_17791 [Monocercomonoides exilis]|uniref:uncharacterized protein n=1 Tax=Monocercomonoides exilis TaxID=2049356 RepID=UPI0035598197|nr:hypothetical protein MONOS_17791 [Monocercomonoides exilis]
MNISVIGNEVDELQEPTPTEKFLKMFCELEHCTEIEQKRIIEEMNKIVYEMNEEEFKSVFTKELFYKMNKMIEDKKLSMGNVLLLLKHVGYYKVLKNTWKRSFEKSSLCQRFEQMIIAESKKMDEKDEKLLVDLCECYLLLYNGVPSLDLILLCIPNLLKVALKKAEDEDTQKEVEMALLCLSRIDDGIVIRPKLYLNEIKAIIKYHQEHRNLTRLAYQSAWRFLFYRFFNDKSLEKVITNELRFAREATRELEELTARMNWKRKEEEGKKEKEKVFIIMRCLKTITSYFHSFKLWNEESIGLISIIADIFRAAKDNYGEICSLCIESFQYATTNKTVKVDDLLKGRAVKAVLEEMQRPTLNDEMVFQCFIFFFVLSRRLNEEENEANGKEAKRKEAKKEIYEKMEEDGYEDVVTSFHERLDYLNREFFEELSLIISDYFVNV